jgi:hypothetical protein
MHGGQYYWPHFIIICINFCMDRVGYYESGLHYYTFGLGSIL